MGRSTTSPRMEEDVGRKEHIIRNFEKVVCHTVLEQELDAGRDAIHSEKIMGFIMIFPSSSSLFLTSSFAFDSQVFCRTTRK